MATGTSLNKTFIDQNNGCALRYKSFYYMDRSVLLENIPLVKFIKLHPGPECLFSRISHVSLSMISLISSLSLKLYLNSFVYHRNIFGSSSKVFGNLRTSSDIFGNFWKMFGNVRLAFGTILENLRKVVGNLRKIIINAVISMSI